MNDYLENYIKEYKNYMEKKIKKINRDNLKNVEEFYKTILNTVNVVKDKRCNSYIYERKNINDILKFNVISRNDFEEKYSNAIDLLYILNKNSFNINRIITVLTEDDLINYPFREVNNNISKLEIERYLNNLKSITKGFNIENKSNLTFDCGEEINLYINNIRLKENVKALIIYHENNLISPMSTGNKFLKKPQFEIIYIK